MAHRTRHDRGQTAEIVTLMEPSVFLGARHATAARLAPASVPI
jgi:hypothetical protein